MKNSQNIPEEAQKQTQEALVTIGLKHSLSKR